MMAPVCDAHGWAPMETAPRDRPIDLWDGQHRVKCSSSLGMWQFKRGYPEKTIIVLRPTHWRESVIPPEGWTPEVEE